MADTVTILNDVKKMLGIMPDYDIFDDEIMLHINSAIMSLTQIGLGPSGGVIADKQSTWDVLLGDRTDLEMAKTYVGFKTKTLFDPPASSVLMEAYNRSLNESIWRIQQAIEYN